MEAHFNYKGYGINYREIGGTTRVQRLGFTLAKFEGVGCIQGELNAKDYIDNLVKGESND